MFSLCKRTDSSETNIYPKWRFRLQGDAATKVVDAGGGCVDGGACGGGDNECSCGGGQP